MPSVLNNFVQSPLEDLMSVLMLFFLHKILKKRTNPKPRLKDIITLGERKRQKEKMTLLRS